MTEKNENGNCHINYDKRCDCSDDDKCGCTYPNNLEMGYDCPGCNNLSSDNSDSSILLPFDPEDAPCFSSLVREAAIDFTAPALSVDNQIIKDFNLSQYIKGSYGLLFFYPLDFTFVCPSELISLNNRIAEFEKRNVKVVAVSVDSVYSHLTWKRMKHEEGGIGDIKFPLVSDLRKEISYQYGILNEEGFPLRATFIIDQKGVIRHQLVNDLPLGRDIDETLRIIDALIHHETSGDYCPAGWNKGDAGLIANFEAVRNFLKKNAHKL